MMCNVSSNPNPNHMRVLLIYFSRNGLATQKSWVRLPIIPLSGNNLTEFVPCCSSVIKQYNPVQVKQRWRSSIGNVGLVWCCIGHVMQT